MIVIVLIPLYSRYNRFDARICLIELLNMRLDDVPTGGLKLCFKLNKNCSLSGGKKRENSVVKESIKLVNI
jgi:hypothetical protein